MTINFLAMHWLQLAPFEHCMASATESGARSLRLTRSDLDSSASRPVCGLQPSGLPLTPFAKRWEFPGLNTVDDNRFFLGGGGTTATPAIFFTVFFFGMVLPSKIPLPNSGV
jgi:hypothetical protein